MKDFYISSDRIVIRAIQDSDADSIYSYRSLPGIAKYQYWEVFTKEQTYEFVKQNSNPQMNNEGKWIGLAVIFQGELIGDCAIKFEGMTAEIGCNISPEYQKQEFAKEALSALISYCFKNWNVSQVAGITDSENSDSIKLMQSLGMKKIPGFENHIICKGKNCIEYKYILKR